MSLQTDLDKEIPSGPDKTREEVQEKTGLILGLSNKFAEMKIDSILRFYRLASFILSSLLFLLFPGDYSINTQLVLLLILLTLSLLMLSLYERFWQKLKVMIALVSFELIYITLLLNFTGGFNGPFLWYALNPFIVATAFFFLCPGMVLYWDNDGRHLFMDILFVCQFTDRSRNIHQQLLSCPEPDCNCHDHAPVRQDAH
ncbi:MAG: hypothetical protein ACQES4_10925 [Bacillota bacterium]